MIGVDLYQLIRFKFAVEGCSQRSIARELGVSRTTVSKYCEGAVVPGQRKAAVRCSPVTDAIRPVVEQWLQEDLQAPRKQRHTAQRIYDRLVDEYGFTGSSSTIRRLVRQLRPSLTEAHVPLEYDPAEAGQVDWGVARIYLNDRPLEVQLFCLRVCHSGAPFVVAFPSQRMEFFLEGHRRAFEFFAGVPRRLFYDNLRTAVKQGWGRHVSQEQEAFLTLRAHYAFGREFCNPGAGHEKSLVENLVGFIRRNVLVPVPRVQSWEELNAQLAAACIRYQQRTWPGQAQCVGERLRAEQVCLTPLPQQPLDTSRTELPVVRWDSTVRFDRNRYSVPTELVGKTVVVKGHSLDVEIRYGDQMVAHYERCFGRDEVRYRWEHYLSLLARKPRSVRNAQPVRRMVPQALLAFREKMSGEHPDRDFVKVLALILSHGQERVLGAVAECVSAGVFTYEGIQHALSPSIPPAAPYERPDAVTVKTVSLGAYDQLLVAHPGGAES